MSKILLPTSSAIEALDYNSELNILYVYFRPTAQQETGRVYGYFNVPLTEWAQLTSSPSSGKYLNEVIKPAGYEYKMIKDAVTK